MAALVTMVAGPNGAGKTTLTRRFRDLGYELGTYINPDDIAAELEGDDLQRVTRAQFIADRQRARCLADGRSFTFETVMSHPNKVAFLRKAKEAGFTVQLVFVGIDDPRINVDRVRNRVALGGHDVPTDRVIARWHRVMALLPDAVRASDRALLYDNSAGRRRGEPGGPALLCTIRDGGSVLEGTLPSAAGRPAWLERCLGEIGLA